jgi:hypothetical protein
LCERFGLSRREGRTGSFLGLGIVHITKNLSSF